MSSLNKPLGTANMNANQSALEQLGVAFRDLIRDTIRAELQAILPAKPAPPADRIGGIKLFAEVTGMAPQTGYNLVAQRAVPFAKRGGKLIFSEVELRDWLLENRQPVRTVSIANAQKYVVKPTRKSNVK